MFSIFKKDNMKSALHECQKQHISIGLDQELSSSMFELVTKTSLFQDINSRFKSKGLSKYGGLAWFCSQTVGTSLDRIENGDDISDAIYELSEKMVFVSFLLRNSIHSLKLTRNDMEAILNAADISERWFESTSSDAEKELFKRVTES